MCGAIFSRVRRSRHASNTRRRWPCSRYRSPPWISRELRELVPAAKSPCSIKAVRIPRMAASRAMPAPVAPPPMIRRSSGSDAMISRLSARVR